MTLDARNQGTSMALMSLMEVGAIEGFTNSKTDRSPQAPRINASYGISVTDGASEFVGGQWGCGFGERSKETLATMKPKDDLEHEESGDFNGLDVVDGAGRDRRFH
jgi:hypothetical protein